MKIKIQIISWLTGSVLFEYEADNNTVKETLEKAVAVEADLRGADLWEANLREANLRGANLREAKGVQMYWHIHHEILVENLTEPLKTRKDYIKSSKPEDEVKLRLKLLKKVKCPIKDYPHTIKGWNDLHKKECKKCPWNGSSIFPNKGKT